MNTEERKHAAVSRPCDQESPAERGAAAQAKKVYHKPVLSKYEQLHGIGIGGSL